MRKTVLLICTAVLCLAPAGCKSDGDSLSSAGTEPASSVSAPKDEVKTVRAVVTGYGDGKLSFRYEDKDYTLPMPETCFDEKKIPYSRDKLHEPTLSERVINNRFGCEVTGEITVSDDMTNIVSCDVLSQTVELYLGEDIAIEVDGNRTHNPELFYAFRKTSPHTCEIYNPLGTLEFDLNDLPKSVKLIFLDEYPIVNFTAVRFHSGDMMLIALHPAEYDKETNTVIIEAGFPQAEVPDKPVGYFGTVRDVSDGQAEVLLNDGKTTIRVPTYFNDGVVERGMRVLVQTGSEDDYIYGKGGEFSFGKVIIYTTEKLFNQSGHDFDDLAYCYMTIGRDVTNSGPYTYITKAQAENK